MKQGMKILFTILLIIAFSKVSVASVTNKRNGEYITLSGIVTSVSDDVFRLKVGDESILVEMDDYDKDADARKLVVNDNVVVSGRVDHDLFEKKKIEAGSVFVRGLNKYYYANSNDEEDYNNSHIIKQSVKELPEDAVIDMKGEVVAVNGREFTVDTGFRKIKVDTVSLGYNPLDNYGLTQVDIGDRVHVTGRIDTSFYDGKEISASYVAEL